VKLVVAAVMLAVLVLVARIVVERVAPEPSASASAGITAPRRAEAAAPKPGTVEALRFSGPGLRAAFLTDVIATREGQPFRADALDSDRQRLLEALVARGHLDAKVGAAHVSWHRGAAIVEFPVDAGPVFVVRSVRVEGRTARSHTGLAQVPTLQIGDAATADDIEASADLLRAWLEARDLRAKVSVATNVEPYGKQVDVRYFVQ